MKQEILDALTAPFAVKTKPGKGNYKYIDSKDVIERMNTVFKGMWSTIVVYKEIIEDHVLVEVLVKAYDDEISQWVEHSGFGSSQISRFTYGDNQGKPLDIGNIYKGALSKAIRSACTRLGAGLTLEVSSGNTSVGASAPPVIPTVNKTAELPTFPSNVPPTPTAAPPVPEPVAVPAPEPVVEEPVSSLIPPTPTAPPVPYEPTPVVEAPAAAPVPPVEAPQAPADTPMTPIERIKQKKAREGNGNTTIPTAPPQAVPQTPAPVADVDYMSDVQFAALDGVLGIKGLQYEALAKEAFAADGRWSAESVPTDPRALMYEQAVIVIKYGNDKNRQLA